MLSCLIQDVWRIVTGALELRSESMGSAASSVVRKFSSKYLINDKINQDKSSIEDNNILPIPEISITPQSENLQYGVHYQIFKKSLETIPLLQQNSKDYLNSLTDSSHNLPYIRLLNKDKFLQHSLIIDCICEIQIFIQEIKLSYDEILKTWKCYPTSQFWSSLMKLLDHRTSLEQLLLWNSEQCDKFFEIFELSECPEYCFFSHCFTSGNYIGLHGELIMYLAHSQHSYIWFDVGCFPFFYPSLSNSINETDFKKILQRRNFFLKHASSFQGYYTSDGLVALGDLELYQQTKDLQEFTPTKGLLSLVLLLENRLQKLSNPPQIDYVRLRKDVQDDNTHHKNNLLGLFDDLFTVNLIKPSSLGSFLPFLSAWFPLSLLPPSGLVSNHDNPDAGTVESLTSQLYARKHLPAIFSLDKFYCLDPLTGRWIPGITLPSIQNLAPSPSFLTPSTFAEPPVTSFGWTFYKDFDIWILNLNWKQNNNTNKKSILKDNIGDICLHLHHKCLVSCREKVIMFNPLKSTIQSFSTISQDHSIQTGISLLEECSSLPCLLCRRIVNSSSSSSLLLSQLISSDWICTYCHWVNDGNLTECIKCKKTEYRANEDIYDERDFQVGDRVHIQYRDGHISPVGYISHVYKCEMYDVIFIDKIEKYIDKEYLIHEGNRHKQQYKKNTTTATSTSTSIDKMYRPCGVCSFLNLSNDITCQLCSVKLSKCTKDQLSDCTFPIGSHVLIQCVYSNGKKPHDDEIQQNTPTPTSLLTSSSPRSSSPSSTMIQQQYTYEPGIIKDIHRYGLYTVELLSNGKILRFIREDMISILSPSSELVWTCTYCSNLNKSYYSLYSTSSSSSTSGTTIIKCSQCGELKPKISHHRHFNYVENASMMMGAKIEAKYHGGEVYYPGIIKNITKDGLYEVEYDHGEVETDVKEDNIIVIAIYCGTFGG